LPEEQWATVTNCPPWTIKRLGAHLITGVSSYLGSIERGLRGELGPWITPEERQRRMEEAEAQSPAELVGTLRAATDRFESTIGALDAEQVQKQATHSHGPRTIRWFADQRLAEVAF